MPDKPAKGMGEPCATLNRMRARVQCVEGVCCNDGVQPRLLHLREPGHGGDLPAGVPGDRSRRALPDRGGRRPAAPPACATAPARARASAATPASCARPRRCVGFMRTTTGTCDSAGGCSGATTLPCTPFQCAPDGKTCRTTCTSDADCVAPNSCVGGQLRQEADRRHLRRQRRVQLDVLRAGKVLSARLAPGRAGRARWRAAKGPAATSPTARTCTATAPMRRVADLRAGRHVQRHGRLPQVRGQHRVRHGFVQRGRRAGGRALRRRRDVRARDAALVQPVRVQRDDELQDQLRDRPPTA